MQPPGWAWGLKASPSHEGHPRNFSHSTLGVGAGPIPEGRKARWVGVRCLSSWLAGLKEALDKFGRMEKGTYWGGWRGDTMKGAAWRCGGVHMEAWRRPGVGKGSSCPVSVGRRERHQYQGKVVLSGAEVGRQMLSVSCS